MPISPYVWNTNDFLTANLLNGELYRTAGQYYQGNGTGWHGVRPIYKAIYPNTSGVTLTANTWTSLGSATPGTWTVVADSAGYLGYRGDWENRGIYRATGLLNGGGGTAVNSQPAGLGVVTANMPFSPASSGIIRAGLGPSSGAQSSTGTMHLMNSVNNVSPWALDIMDLNLVNGISPWVNSSVTPHNVSNLDGSNQTPRVQAFWASVYPANGATVASLPTPTASWTSSSPALTASYMNGLTGIAAVMNLLNMPPLLRATGLGSGTSVATGTTTTCVYGTKTYDTYNAYNTTTHTYTAPLKGIYLVYNCFPFDAFGVSTTLEAGVTIGGTSYFGPGMYLGGTGGAAAKVQVFSLNAGDTIVPVVFQNSGSTVSGSSTYSGLFIVVYLGLQGAPGTLPTVPDFTYSWIAGTPASAMPGLMNAHFANDLLFLSQRPYLLAYQNTAQTGIAQASATDITMNSVTGIIHADAGDNYSGWNSGSNLYSAQRAGWYLAVQETLMAAPSLTVSPLNLAGFEVSPGGTYPADFYQAANSVIGSGGGGAAAVGLYYLRAGDTIEPVVYSVNTSSTTTSTYVATGHNSHFELVWLGE